MYKLFSRRIAVLLLVGLMFSSLAPTVFAEGKKTPSGIEYSKLKETIDDYVKAFIGTTTAGASVAVMQNDEIVFKSNYGFSDIQNEVAVSDNTLFEWGSTSKLLIWVSVMQLVEQGKLDLNTDIKSYLPENFFHKLNFDQPITLLNLMNHNAGWEEHLTDIFYKNPQDVKNLKETLEVFEPAQVYAPGEVVAYSNYGAAVAAYIVEHMTGMPFYEYVNQNIFDVLNMKETSIEPVQNDNSVVQKNRPSTKGYALTAKGFKERPLLYLGVYPAGGAIGSLSDLCKFVGALVPKDRENSPLFKNENTFALMFSESYSVADDFPGINHGFWAHYYSVRTLEHAGNTDSFSSQITFAPEEGVAVVIMTNQAHERPLCFGLKDLIFGSYKADEFESSLPDASVVEGNYRYMRRPHSGFSQWLNFTVSEVTKIDERSIDIDGDVYNQIRPYVYHYTDRGGASEFVYFRTDNNEVTRMVQEYGEYEPVGTLTIISILGRIGLFAVCFIYFVISSIISLIYGLKRKNNLTAREKYVISLNLVGFASLANTMIMFARSITYPSYAALKIHFIINILAFAMMGFMIGRHIITNTKRKSGNEKKIGTLLTNIFSGLVMMLIITCQIYK